MGIVAGPFVFAMIYILSKLWWYFWLIGALALVAVVVAAFTPVLDRQIAKLNRQIEAVEREIEAEGGMGEAPPPLVAPVVSRPRSDFRSSSAASPAPPSAPAQAHQLQVPASTPGAASARSNRQAPLASVPGMVPSSAGAHSVDRRFALIDRAGRRRYAQIINGTFQVGKARTALPTNLHAFARYIIEDGNGGRFATGDGVKHGILGYGARAREAVAYELDPAVAALAGVPRSGRL